MRAASPRTASSSACRRAPRSCSLAARAQATITELAYVPDSLVDGPYLLELQVPALSGDAVPSRPLLYALHGGRSVSAPARCRPARARDAADPLRGLRARFAHPSGPDGAPKVYLCGHSLGLMPLAARELITQELDDWARLGVEGHEHARRPWIPYHENLTAGLAALTGAAAGEVVAMNSLTVNLHLMLASFYRAQGAGRRILIEAGAFSSDRHAVTSHLAWPGSTRPRR